MENSNKKSGFRRHFGNFDRYGRVIFVNYFLDFNTCKHFIFVIMITVLSGLFCWSKRMACMML